MLDRISDSSAGMNRKLFCECAGQLRNRGKALQKAPHASDGGQRLLEYLY